MVSLSNHSVLLRPRNSARNSPCFQSHRTATWNSAYNVPISPTFTPSVSAAMSRRWSDVTSVKSPADAMAK